jgi:hypothetical protein
LRLGPTGLSVQSLAQSSIGMWHTVAAVHDWPVGSAEWGYLPALASKVLAQTPSSVTITPPSPSPVESFVEQAHAAKSAIVISRCIVVLVVARIVSMLVPSHLPVVSIGAQFRRPDWMQSCMFVSSLRRVMRNHPPTIKIAMMISGTKPNG